MTSRDWIFPILRRYLWEEGTDFGKGKISIFNF
jgi:hypothetical protein